MNRLGLKRGTASKSIHPFSQKYKLINLGKFQGHSQNCGSKSAQIIQSDMTLSFGTATPCGRPKDAKWTSNDARCCFFTDQTYLICIRGYFTGRTGQNLTPQRLSPLIYASDDCRMIPVQNLICIRKFEITPKTMDCTKNLGEDDLPRGQR